MKRQLFLIVAALGLDLSGVAPVRAHAFLDHAEPGVGGSIAISPAVVKVWLTKDVMAASSNIKVFDAAGKEVDRKDSKLAPDDQSLLQVSLSRLPAGTYKVIWQATCWDAHRTGGTFSFTVTNPKPKEN